MNSSRLLLLSDTVVQPSPMPAVPTRDQVCSGHLSFQGLSAQTRVHGEVRLDCVDALDDPVDRWALFAAKRALADTHAYLMISHAYFEPGIAPWLANGKDWTQDLNAFHDFVKRTIIEWGGPVMVFLAGDGQSRPKVNGQYPYNDPVGWTYGHQWLMDMFPAIADALRDLAPYILFMVGFDGVFYGWTPLQVEAFGVLFREYLPLGHLGVEHNTGHIPCGDGEADYIRGRMQTYDVIASEFDRPIGTDSTWQVVARLGGDYHRPPDQPDGDDPRPPWYTRTPTPRGVFHYWKLEFLTYWWVRDQVALAEVQSVRNYLAALGPGSLG